MVWGGSLLPKPPVNWVAVSTMPFAQDGQADTGWTGSYLQVSSGIVQRPGLRAVPWASAAVNRGLSDPTITQAEVIRPMQQTAKNRSILEPSNRAS